MSSKYFDLYKKAFAEALEATEVHSNTQTSMAVADGFDALCLLSKSVQNENKQQFIIGNGASAGIANHMSLDWTKNGRVRTRSFANATLLTAMGNDLGFEKAFSSPLEWYALPGDMLVTISSSGNSPNIINAIEVGRTKGMKVVTFSGLRPDNQSRSLGDLNFYVPAKTYGIVECTHQALMHCWLDQFMGIEE